MLISALLNEFHAWNGRHRAPATCRFYGSRLQAFGRQFGNRDFGSLTPLEIDRYLDQAGQGMTDSTKHHNIVAIERLHGFALENKLLDRPLFAPKHFEKPRIGQRTRLPTDAETAAILKRASPAFALIYAALRQCGARPGELCRLDIADVDREKGVIVLMQHKTARKTGKPRRFPIGKKFGLLLDQAIAGRPAGPVFRTKTGRRWTVPHLSRTYTLIRQRAKLAEELVLYLARHEFGTKVCRQKGIDVASRLLGHANLQTTQRYVHPDDQELADAQDAVE